MRNRLAGGALAVAVATAVTIAYGDHTAATAGQRSHPGAFLGPHPSRTWVPSRRAPKSIVWAVGDGADGGSAGRAVAGMIAANRADRFLYLGDVYQAGTAADYASNYRPSYGRFDAIAAPTIGNHEWPNVATGYTPYWTAARGAPAPLWYAFAVSGWQLISLNSNLPSGDGSPQLAWLRRTIRNSPRYGTCRLVFVHYPRFSAGLHGDTPALDSVFQAMSGHATILLSGHDHDMERLRPVRGITQLVSGAGGNDRYAVNRADPRLAFADDSHFGALRMKLIPDRSVLSFVAGDGSLLDRSTARCHQG